MVIESQVMGRFTQMIFLNYIGHTVLYIVALVLFPRLRLGSLVQVYYILPYTLFGSRSLLDQLNYPPVMMVGYAASGDWIGVLDRETFKPPIYQLYLCNRSPS